MLRRACGNEYICRTSRSLLSVKLHESTCIKIVHFTRSHKVKIISHAYPTVFFDKKKSSIHVCEAGESCTGVVCRASDKNTRVTITRSTQMYRTFLFNGVSETRKTMIMSIQEECEVGCSSNNHTSQGEYKDVESGLRTRLTLHTVLRVVCAK